MRTVRQTFGSLECEVIDDLPAGVKPELGVVFCHGYGAPQTDLVPLAEVLLQVEPELSSRVQFLFPGAPVSLADQGMFGGYAWWPLSLQRLQAQLTASRFHEIRQECPEGLEDAAEKLRGAVSVWMETNGLAWPQVILGGFSQGAMLTMEAVAGLPERPAGAVLYSGALIHETAWRAGWKRMNGLPVLQSHGRQDVVLPFLAGNWLAEVLNDSGVSLEALDFNGGHQIPFEVLEATAAFLLKRCQAG
ncbi:phospholipase [bacterium]|nr:phospholipase [bacterium]